MEEKKKKKVELPAIKAEVNGELRELKVVSALLSKDKEDRFANLVKTEDGSYMLYLLRKVEGGEDIRQELCLSKEGFAILCGTVLMFLNEELVGDLETLFGDYTNSDFQWSYVKEGDEIEEDEE